MVWSCCHGQSSDSHDANPTPPPCAVGTRSLVTATIALVQLNPVNAVHHFPELTPRTYAPVTGHVSDHSRHESNVRRADSLAAMGEILVVGGGRMGAALVTGWIRAGWSPGSIAIAERYESRRNELTQELPGVVVIEPSDVSNVVNVDNDAGATNADRVGGAGGGGAGGGGAGGGAGGDSAGGVVLAVKPADAEAAARLVAETGHTRVLSIMAGVPTELLSKWLGPRPSVMRAMPNTPALVGAGISALAAGAGASEDDLRWGESLLAAVGQVVRVDESLMDAVTGLSGSGPAYVFFVLEGLISAGIEAGLPAETSRDLARQTIVGAAQLLAASGEAPEVLRAQVTSPGGTTEAGIAALEAFDLARGLSDAVKAAARRSEELRQDLLGHP
jgi:pyrroline-5-carboxylate reductase